MWQWPCGLRVVVVVLFVVAVVTHLESMLVLERIVLRKEGRDMCPLAGK